MKKSGRSNQTKTPSRREFLTSMAVAGGSLAGASAFSSAASLADPTAYQGSAVSNLGKRSSAETPERAPAYNILSLTPLEQLHGTITPADLHFERHHGGIPSIDPIQHKLLIHGLVSKPLKFSVEDLKRFPAVTRTCFIECSGNLNTRATPQSSPQMLCGLTSQSEWTGVSLRTLLREAGMTPGASWCLAEGSDAAVMARSIPVEKLLDDAMVAYAQNGEALRPAQGYPMRLLLPGWEGNTNIKWLRRLELSDAPSMTREETSKYTDPLKDDTSRQFSVIMDARSVITYPTYPRTLEPGWHEIRGIAWSGRGRIRAVEVSVDSGKTWRTAELQGPVLPKAHTRFGFSWHWGGEPTEIASRAIDDTGYVQPTRRQLINARGPGNNTYHLNPIMYWIVERDGQILYKAESWA